jgi:hypothetical protein
MVAHYDRDRLRRNSERPAAITDVLVTTDGGGFRTADLPLGLATCSARGLTRPAAMGRTRAGCRRGPGPPPGPG